VARPDTRSGPDTSGYGQEALFRQPDVDEEHQRYSEGESAELAAALVAHATRPEFVLRHIWQSVTWCSGQTVRPCIRRRQRITAVVNV